MLRREHAAEVREGQGQIAKVFFAFGEVLRQPLDLRQLLAIVGLGLGEAVGLLLERCQSPAVPDQRLAMAGHRGEIGDQGLEHPEGLPRVLLGPLDLAQLAMNPASGVDCECQLTAIPACLASVPRASSSTATARS